MSPHECSGMGGLVSKDYTHMVSTVALNFTGMQNGDRVFEAGSGCGAFTYFLKKIHPQSKMLGVDYTESMLKVARAALPAATGNGPWCRADIRNYTFVPPESVDHVVSVAVPELFKFMKCTLINVNSLTTVNVFGLGYYLESKFS